MLQLRDYQDAALRQVFAAWRGGARSVLLALSTGAGKRIMALWLLQYAHENCRKVLFVGNRRLLINQAADDAEKYQVPYGVIMADTLQGDFGSRNQIASLQTLESRCIYEKWSNIPTGHGLPEANLVIVDEAHQQEEAYQRLFAFYPEAKILGLTATPVGSEGKSLSPHPYDVLIEGVLNSQLIAQGHLLPTKVFAPSEPSLAGVRVVAKGEYNQNQLGKRIQECHVAADVFREWEPYREQATVCFVPGVAFGNSLCEQFNQRYGHGTAHIITAKTKPAEREEAFGQIESGESSVLISVNVLCLDSETEILTSRGFVSMDDFRAEDRAANWHMPQHHSLQPTITFEKPLEVFRRRRAAGERMAVLKTKRGNIRVTEGHKMAWRTGPTCSYKVGAASDIAGRHVSLPVCGQAAPLAAEVAQPLKVSDNQLARLTTATAYNLRQAGMSSSAARIEAGQRVQRKYSLRRKHPGAMTLDECRFIGFWIGDGRRAPLQSGGLEYYVVAGLVYPNIIRWFDGICERMGYDFCRNTYHSDSPHVKWSFPRGTGGGSQARHGVFAIEHFLDKDLGDLLWSLNKPQFDAFIEGFWYAEGLHGQAESTPKLGWLVSNTNKGLLDTIQAVAVCRGWRARIRAATRKNRPEHHSQLWLLHLRQAQDAQIGLRQHHAIQLEDKWTDEPVWCIKSTSGFIVTRRNGIVTVLGNCEGFDLPKLSCEIDLQPNQQLRSYWQKVGRIKRPHQGQEHAVLLDFAGNYWRYPHPDEDPEWPQGDSAETSQELIERKRREKGEPQPIMCPACSFVRSRGPSCPNCGRQAGEAIRRIRMGNGKLQEVPAVARQAHKASDAERLFNKWQSRLFGALRSGLSYAQCAHLFQKQTGRYPDQGWVGTFPRGSIEWKLKPMDQFTPGKLSQACRIQQERIRDQS